jgi:putative phosphoribosyl transferase
MELPFQDRQQAGKALAKALQFLQGRSDTLVLALPRGGVPVAFEVARAIQAPLDLMLVRKLGVPGQEELAMGAIAMGGFRMLNQDIVRGLSIQAADIEKVEQQESLELERRLKAYRGDKPLPDLRDRCLVLVDDGVATGATMRVAVAAVRQQHPRELLIAVPVAPASTARLLSEEVDQFICLATPHPFYAIGSWYRNFNQVSDDKVRALLSLSEAVHE